MPQHPPRQDRPAKPLPPPEPRHAGNPPPRNYLADELRRIADAPAVAPPAYRDRLRMLAAEVDQLATGPVEVDASTELTASFGLEPEQECRAQAARALGWRSPSDTDLPDYHVWWWAELGRLADWIRDGTPPAGAEPCYVEEGP